MAFGPPCHQCGSEFNWLVGRDGEKCHCGWPAKPDPNMPAELPNPSDHPDVVKHHLRMTRELYTQTEEFLATLRAMREPISRVDADFHTAAAMLEGVCRNRLARLADHAKELKTKLR